MSEKQIEVNIITQDPEYTLLKGIVLALEAKTRIELVTALQLVKDSFDEYKLQNNSVIL